MGLGKKDIVKNISSKTQFSNSNSKSILESFFNILKNNVQKNIKISNFGTFTIKKTPERVGRNPKTKEEVMITAKKRISFKAANQIKNLLN
jgi:nucleoid DNA-binding protein